MSATLYASTLPLRGDTDMTDKTDAELDTLQKRLRNPPFGTETSERNLMDAADAAIASLRKQLDEAREREATMAAALREAVKRCETVEYDDVGGPVKWKDIRYTFACLVRGDTYDPEFGRWSRQAALSQEPPASHAPGLRDAVMVPREVIDFLCGAAPLDGIWFSERHPKETGAFWWRRRLRAALPTTGQEQP